MSLRATTAQKSKYSPGAKYRSILEENAKVQALPEGKGEVGTLKRDLIESPMERDVAPGATKQLAIKPPVMSPDVGIVSPNATSPFVSTTGGRQIGGAPLAVKDRGTTATTSDTGATTKSSEGNVRVLSAQEHGVPESKANMTYISHILENAYGRDFSDLEKRLVDMRLSGKEEWNSKKFAKLWPRYKSGGITVTGHKSVEEMNEAGERQRAARAEEAYKVARMNMAGQQRKRGIVSQPAEATPKTSVSSGETKLRSQEQEQTSGQVLGASTSSTGAPRSYWDMTQGEKDMTNYQVKSLYQDLSDAEEYVQLYSDAIDRVGGAAPDLVPGYMDKVKKYVNAANEIKSKIRSIEQETGGY